VTTLALNLPTLKGAGDKLALGNLIGSSLTLACCQLVSSSHRPWIILCSDTPTAIKLEHELRDLLDEASTEVLLLPDWETLPYDNFSPHEDIISQRLSTLYRLSTLQNGVVIVPVNTAMMLSAPVEYLRSSSLLISKNQKLDTISLRNELENSGYRSVEQVIEHGEFSARGSILDIFPMGALEPYRIDFFDNEIDSIRPFDSETQRSKEPIAKIELLPAHEFPSNKAGIEQFRKNWRAKFEVSRETSSPYHQVSNNIMPAGIEYYLPLFFEQTASFFDYLSDASQFIVVGDIEQAALSFTKLVATRFEERNFDIHRPLLSPNELYLSCDQMFAKLKSYARIQLSEPEIKTSGGRRNAKITVLPDIAINHNKQQPLAALTTYLNDFKGKILFSVESQGRREALLELLTRINILPVAVDDIEQLLTSPQRIGLMISQLDRSVVFTDSKLSLICESELFGGRVAQRRSRNKSKATNADQLIRNLTELSIGQAVVHLEHGVGRYQGLTTLSNAGLITEYLLLEYQKAAKLYVPVSSLHLISRYNGSAQETAPIGKLGSDTWGKARAKAAEKVRDVAAELLDIYANRAARKGHGFTIDHEQYLAFSQGFGFEETPDQKQAIDATINDMLQKRSMDRLVCGDVGFGKTEVAMRATFVAVNGGKQAAILVPTTLLAQQHYDNFCDRFADWPIKIEILSRFRTTKQQNQALKELAEGKIDILVGTHKLLSGNVKFSDLGLLIVDEEHRFGVRQKDKIKALRSDVDILTLTATPIPRTLNMAMSGMRDLSIIATPPQKRLAVKTFVHKYEKSLVNEAAMREISRGGQLYYLHNSVDTIERVAQDLREEIPNARICVAHGQMRERDLERIMSDFYHQRYNILVCTTIIETGIDIPSANTIIIDRADNFGLAQLHQLRGRVGRSHHQAYAYLMTPPEKLITKDARLRLDAISDLEDLGSGFTLATQDLEIRGAGELLGDEQSGQIHSVGFDLYMEMLDQAIQALKAGKQPSLDSLLKKQCEIDLKLPALLPDDYIGDVSIRLTMYKRIASSINSKQLRELQVELIDRFGLLPTSAKNLIQLAEMKLQAGSLGIVRIDMDQNGGSIEFSQTTKVSPDYLVSLLQTQPKQFQLVGPSKLKLSLPTPEQGARIELAKALLTEFSQHSN